MTTEELTARIERLEQIVEKSPMERGGHPFWDRIPLSAWLKLSGPGFAVMALGFGVLWNGQQATTQRILELQASTTDRMLELQRKTTDRIMEAQQKTTEQIMEAQQKTTDQIMELQRTTTDRLLGMQQQILDLQRESRQG